MTDTLLGGEAFQSISDAIELMDIYYPAQVKLLLPRRWFPPRPAGPHENGYRYEEEMKGTHLRQPRRFGRSATVMTAMSPKLRPGGRERDGEILEDTRVGSGGDCRLGQQVMAH